MDARIHQGEMVIDPVVSAGLKKYGIPVQGGGNEEVVAELRAVKAELAAVKKELVEIKGHNAAGVRVNQSVGKRLIEQGEAQLVGARETRNAARHAAAR
jgi:hypothetical protein